MKKPSIDEDQPPSFEHQRSPSMPKTVHFQEEEENKENNAADAQMIQTN